MRTHRVGSITTWLVQVLRLGLMFNLSAATCYYPNGNPASRDVQCKPGPNSACCGRGSICLSNGLCLSVVQPFGISRGSCTDPSFKIDECPKVCRNIQPNGGCTIVLYNNTEEGVFYCCNSIVKNITGSQPMCAWEANPFTLESATIVPGAALLEDYVQKSDSDSYSDSTNTTAPSNQSEPDHCPEPSSLDHVAVGAGVGVPLGLTAVSGIAWAIYERRRRLRAAQQMARAANSTVGPVYNSVGDGYFQKEPTNQQDFYSGPVELAERSSAVRSGFL